MRSRRMELAEQRSRADMIYDGTTLRYPLSHHTAQHDNQNKYRTAEGRPNVSLP